MATNRHLKPGLVVALAVSLLLAGVAFATPLLQRSQVAVTCVNTGLAQSAQTHRFAGPSQRQPCSRPRHRRALGGRVAVTQIPETSIPVPPLTHDQTGTASPIAVKDGSPVTQPPGENQPPEGESPGEEAPQDTTPPETSISAGPASMTGSTSAKLFFAATEEGSSFECDLDGAGWSRCCSQASHAGLGCGSH